MIVGRGFSYKNVVGKYYIENDLLKYDSEDRKEVIYNSLIKPDSQNSILIEFSSIDISKEMQIVEFCNKYGRLDLLDFDDFAKKPFDPNNSKFESINIYKIFINNFKAILSLREAIENCDKIGILKYSLYLLVSEINEYQGIYSNYYGEWITFTDILKEVSTNPNKEELINSLEIPDNNEIEGDLKFIIEKLLSLGIVYPFPIINYIDFNVDFGIDNTILNETLLNPTELITFGNFALVYIINTYLESAKFRLRYSFDKKLNGYWYSPNLLISLYIEAFLMFSQDKKIRKCQNRTCSKYFEIIGNDTRKIYCSSDCARLEAKRMERDRKKKQQNAGA